MNGIQNWKGQRLAQDAKAIFGIKIGRGEKKMGKVTKLELQRFAVNLFSAKHGTGHIDTPIGVIKRLNKTQDDISKGRIKTLRGVRSRIR